MTSFSFLEKLKHIINIENVTVNINLISIKNNCNNITDKYHYSDDDKEVVLYLNNFTDSEKQFLKPILHEAIDSGVCLLDEKSKIQTEEIVITERSVNEQSLLSFYKDRIPIEDYTALRASLVLRNRFENHANKREIDKLKSEIVRKYGKRGRNISDHCSAQYFEALMNVYKNIPIDEFQEIYEGIVGEGAFTLFVSETTTPIIIIQEIVKRINKNNRYGAHGIIFIHGIGHRNIETIKIAIEDLSVKYPNIEIRSSHKNYVMQVSMKF